MEFRGIMKLINDRWAHDSKKIRKAFKKAEKRVRKDGSRTKK
jgi:hypothetical protein